MTFAEPFSPARLAELRRDYDPRSSEKADLLAERFRLARSGRHSVYYAPIASVPSPATKLMFVGLTPGLSQMQLAADLFRNAAPAIVNDPTAFANLVRTKVAFAGSMRTNLCGMLDKLNMPVYLGVEKSADLFAESRSDVATTSALVFPVFTGLENKNFGGTTDLAASALFREMLDVLLLPRVLASSQSLIIPLGDSASSGIRYLVQHHGLDSRRILFGLPHPSGGNGHRVKHFAERKVELEERLRNWFAT